MNIYREEVDGEVEERGKNAGSKRDVVKVSSIKPSGRATAGLQQSSAGPFLPQVASPPSTNLVSVPSQFSAALPTRQPSTLVRDEAYYVHHFTEFLGRWLDGTDSAHQFTLRATVRARHCPILLFAIVSFAARHLHDDGLANRVYQHCITLLIERLTLNVATYDEDLLCAIVILHFFKQLNAPPPEGADSEQHLVGCAAILRASQTHVVDPSAPTLRDAPFWVYLRQCLYKSVMNQQAPNVNISLRLEPEPASMQDPHPLAYMRLETTFANQIAWHCVCIANFCFGVNDTREKSQRLQRWQELWDFVQLWQKERPISFEPTWHGDAAESSTALPEIWSTADWHGKLPGKNWPQSFYKRRGVPCVH